MFQIGQPSPISLYACRGCAEHFCYELPMKLLVVEDERRMLKLLHRGLQEEGHTVLCATDGIAGLRLVENQEFDVVILDVMMPRMDGFEVARQMRRANNFTPVLMLTAKDAVPDVVNGLDLGADDYMTKPFSFAELLLRLRAVRRHFVSSQPVRLRVGDLVLDRCGHQVHRDGIPIRLTRKEFGLLERLMQQAGTVVPRDALTQSVWGKGPTTEANTLDAFIRLLRRKIDRPGCPSLIHTVRSTGYLISSGEP